MKRNGLVATYGFDGLVAGSDKDKSVKGILLKGGQGILKRGTVLAKDADSKYVILGTKDASDKVYPPNCILTDDTDTGSEDVHATAYDAGRFATQKLSMKDNYTLTEDNFTELRRLNIYLEQIMEV